MSSKEQTQSNKKTNSKRQSSKSTLENSELKPQPDLAALVHPTMLDPGALSSPEALQLQRTIGNQAVTQLLAGQGSGQDSAQSTHPLLQAKLAVGPAPAIQSKGKLPGNGEISSAVSHLHKTGQPDSLKTGSEKLAGYSLGKVKEQYNQRQPAQIKVDVLPKEKKQKSNEIQRTLEVNGNLWDDKDINEAEMKGWFTGETEKTIGTLRSWAQSELEYEFPTWKDVWGYLRDRDRKAIEEDEMEKGQPTPVADEDLKQVGSMMPWSHGDKLKHRAKTVGGGVKDVGFGAVGVASSFVAPGSAEAATLGHMAWGSAAAAAGALDGAVNAEEKERGLDAMTGAFDGQFGSPWLALMSGLQRLYHWRDLPAERFGDEDVIGEIGQLIQRATACKQNEIVVKLEEMKKIALQRIARAKHKEQAPRTPLPPGTTFDLETVNDLLDGMITGPSGDKFRAVQDLRPDLSKAVDNRNRYHSAGDKGCGRTAFKILEGVEQRLEALLKSQHAKRKQDKPAAERARQLLVLVRQELGSLGAAIGAGDSGFDEYTKLQVQWITRLDELKTFLKGDIPEQI